MLNSALNVGRIGVFTIKFFDPHPMHRPDKKTSPEIMKNNKGVLFSFFL
jgi:hypothetical protein